MDFVVVKSPIGNTSVPTLIAMLPITELICLLLSKSLLGQKFKVKSQDFS